MSDESLGENTGNAAERIIARFGGIRPLASKLEVAVSTVQGWKNRGQIPAARREQIERAAKELDIDLETGELDAATGAVGASPQLPAPSAQTEEAAPAGTSLENEQMDETPWGGVGNADPSERPDDPPVGEGPGPSGPHQKANPLPLMLLGGLLVAAGAAVAILLSDYWMPAQEPPLAASVEALERRMARVEEQRADTSEEALPTLQRDLEQTRARLE